MNTTPGTGPFPAVYTFRITEQGSDEDREERDRESTSSDCGTAIVWFVDGNSRTAEQALRELEQCFPLDFGQGFDMCIAEFEPLPFQQIQDPQQFDRFFLIPPAPQV